MKHYLDLVPISAKIHKKQSRMSIFCIVLAVFLVTTIFGMADMFIRSQILQAQQESGNWHIAIKNISNEEAAIIASRPDIEVFSPYGVLNYRGDLGYTLGGKDVAICGCDESYITEIWTDQIEEGVFPQTSNEALVTENAKQIMGVAIGDPIAVETPDGDKLNFTISGFMNNTASIMSGDSYGIILNTEDYCAIYPNVSDGEPNDYGIMFFTQFANTRNIQGKIADLKEQCNLSNEQISSNNNLLGLLGQSRVPFLLQVYLAAAVLFVLVMLAGIMTVSYTHLQRVWGAPQQAFLRALRPAKISECGHTRIACQNAQPATWRKKRRLRFLCLLYTSQGFVSSLALGYNEVEIQRGMTTSSTAIFIPFMTRELRMAGQALYYGMNALSHNVIMADRKKLKSANGMYLGSTAVSYTHLDVYKRQISARCGRKQWRFTEAAGTSCHSAQPCSGISKNTSGILCRRTPKPG